MSAGPARGHPREGETWRVRSRRRFRISKANAPVHFRSGHTPARARRLASPHNRTWQVHSVGNLARV